MPSRGPNIIQGIMNRLSRNLVGDPTVAFSFTIGTVLYVIFVTVLILRLSGYSVSNTVLYLTSLAFALSFFFWTLALAQQTEADLFRRLGRLDSALALVGSNLGRQLVSLHDVAIETKAEIGSIESLLRKGDVM